MTWKEWIQGLLRHTGYALLIVNGGFIIVELFVPGFSTPYLNTYALVSMGFVLTLLGGGKEGGQRSKLASLGGGICIAGISIFLLASGTVSGTSTSALIVATAGLLIAFILQSMYAEDV